MSNTYLEEFCTSYNFKNSINAPTCLRNPENQTGIDQTLRNHAQSFHSSAVYETCLPDFQINIICPKGFHFTKFQ